MLNKQTTLAVHGAGLQPLHVHNMCVNELNIQSEFYMVAQHSPCFQGYEALGKIFLNITCKRFIV